MKLNLSNVQYDPQKVETPSMIHLLFLVLIRICLKKLGAEGHYSATTQLPGPLRQSWPMQSDYRKITIHSKLVVGQSAAHKKNNRLLEAQNLILIAKILAWKTYVFLFETLHKTPRRDISLTQAVILSSTSNFFITTAALCNNAQSLPFISFTHSNGPLRKRAFFSGFKGSHFSKRIMKH